MEIKWKDVEYNDFHDLNLEISNNDITGIFGRGKSTILQLLGAVKIGKGLITYDNLKLDKNNLNQIRKKISIIDQEFKKQTYLKFMFVKNIVCINLIQIIPTEAMHLISTGTCE